MTPHRVHPPGLPDVPYAYATVSAPADSIAFLAGACPLDEAGVVVAPDDVVAQARVTVANLRTVLDAAGATLADVLKTTVFVAARDHGELVRAWQAVKAEMEGADPPSTLVGVSFLGYTGQRIEVEAVAVAKVAW